MTAADRIKRPSNTTEILLLSGAHPPDDLRVVLKEGAALAAAGWRVRHLAPGAPAAPWLLAGVAIETYRRPPGWIGRLRSIPALARRAAATRARVLHASEPDAWLAALLAARRWGARVVIDVHEHYPSRLDQTLPAPLRAPVRVALRALCWLVGHAADAVVVAKDGLDNDYGVPRRTVAVRNYALASAIQPRMHGPGPVSLVHAGAMSRSRGWPQLLDAMLLVAPDTRLRLIGRFTDGSEADFVARAEALGLTARIERLPWLPHDEALARLAEGDIALVLFQPGQENHRLALPHKLFDAMLVGLPVIAPAFAEEVATVIQATGCGVLVDSAAPAEIAAAITALADPGRRAEIGLAGREAAEAHYAWAPEAARLVRLYAQLMRSEKMLR